MINKSYQIKVYWLDGTFKSTISPKKVMKNLTFSENINGWQWQMTVSLAIPFADATFGLTDVVQVTCFDASNMNWRLIYTWYITKFQRNYSNAGESVDLVCIGLYAMLNAIFYNSGGYVFTKNQAPDQTIKDIVDFFNSQYTANRFSYSAWHVSPYGSNLNISFDYTKCNEAIANIQKATNDFFFYIDENGDVTYKTNTFSTLDHKFTIWKDVEAIDVDESVENVSNKIMLKRGGSWTERWPYQDAWSIATYWKREKVVTASDIQDGVSADIYWNTYISKNKDSKKEIVLTINSNYDLESIRPGQFVSVYNTDFQMKQLQIQKIDYRSESVRVYLDQYTTFSQSILSNK